MSAADPPVAQSQSLSQDVDTTLPQLSAFDSDSGSEGYADAIQDFSIESKDGVDMLPPRRGAVQQLFRVSIQLDKFHLSLLNTLGLWSNPILDAQFTDTMVDYLVGTDGRSSMGLSSCIMLTQWNPMAKVICYVR
jgi:hypothetical protein